MFVYFSFDIIFFVFPLIKVKKFIKVIENSLQQLFDFYQTQNIQITTNV